MSIFNSPGLADESVSSDVISSWNKLIETEVSSRDPSPFLELDPVKIPNGEISSAVKWPGHPLEPTDCLGETIAEQLSDWGWLGRAELHNEYLEYSIVMQHDAAGNLRPKRFIATTELKEWWLTMAVHDISYFIKAVNSITGKNYSSQELFGVDEVAWKALPEDTRSQTFNRRIVGSPLRNPPFWRPPEHSLNQEHVLFMAHPINGLDDLIYVVHFGSFAYMVQQDGSKRRARLEEIFIDRQVEYLFCRNADPGAAAGAYSQVFLDQPGTPKGKQIAFGNPLGMYIRTFSEDDLRYKGNEVPKEWIRKSRGDENGTPQRLEFGPGDSEAAFLDEITIGSGVNAPVINGYQLAKRIEVGPLVMIARDARDIASSEFVEVQAADAGTITCGLSEDDRCKRISDFHSLYQSQNSLVPGTRGQIRG